MKAIRTTGQWSDLKFNAVWWTGRIVTAIVIFVSLVFFFGGETALIGLFGL